MIVETLSFGSEERVLGITEIENLDRLSSDDLIASAQTVAGDLMAIRLINPDLIAAPIHLISAAQNALNAWAGEYKIARSLDVEILVYASAQTQIGRALQLLGLHDDQASVGVIMVSEDGKSLEEALQTLLSMVGPECPTPFAASESRLRRVAEAFGVSETEMSTLKAGDSIEDRIEALARCVVSRVSLVAVES